MLVLLPAAVAGAAPSNPSMTVLAFIVPPEFSGGKTTVVVEALAPFNIVVDLNGNLAWDPGEQNITVSGEGLRRVSLTVEGSGPLVLLVNRTGAWGVLSYVDLGRSMAASSQPLPGSSRLYAPPVEGMVALTPLGGRPVEVSVGGERVVVEPGSVAILCKPANVTIIEGNGTLAGIFYVFNVEASNAAAAPLLSDEQASRIVGFSTRQAAVINGKVYALVSYLDGGGGVLYVDAAGSRVALDRPAATWYLIESEGSLALAPAPPSNPKTYPYGRLLYLRDQGILLPNFLVVLDAVYNGYSLLADTDGDGAYEVPIFDFGYLPVWVAPGHGVVGVVRGGSPLTVEYAPGMLAAYRGLPANVYNATDLTLRKILDNELVEMTLTLIQDTPVANITIRPRPGAGPISEGVAAAFTGGLQPIRGTVTKLTINDTAGEAIVPIPRETFNEGGLIVALITYYNTVSVVTLPAVNATAVAEPATPDLPQCTSPEPRLLQGNITRIDIESLTDIPPIVAVNLQLEDLAAMMQQAVDTPIIRPTPTTEQNTTTQTATLPPAPTATVEKPGGTARIAGVAVLIIAVAALLVAFKLK